MSKPRRGGHSVKPDKPVAAMLRTPRTKDQECGVAGCGHSEKQFPGKVFYVLPYETDRQTQWLRLIDRLDLLDSEQASDTRVCSDHFDVSAYTSRGALKPTAEPTLLLPEAGETFREKSPEPPERPKLAKLAPKPAKLATKPRAPKRPIESQDQGEPLSTYLGLEKKPHLETIETIEIEIQEVHDVPPHGRMSDTAPSPHSEPVRVKIERFDDSIELQSCEILSRKSHVLTPNAVASSKFTAMVQVKEEPMDEPVERNHDEEVEEEAMIVQPVDADTQCRDPLAIVKSEPDCPKTVATQTFSRKELYFIKASKTGVEQIDLPAPPRTARHKVTYTRTVHLQTTANLLNCYTVPVKRALEAKIREVNRKTNILESAYRKKIDKQTFMNCCEKYLDEKIVFVVQSHWHLQEKSKGNRYGDNFKLYANHLYLSNPQSYKFVEQIFNLPSKTTIKRQQTVSSTGTNWNLLAILKNKVDNMTEKEKVCAISFDAMLLNKNLWYEVHNDFFCGMQDIDEVMGPEPAEYAVVLMVRGLYTKWTQPVSYALVSEKRRYPELKEWMHKIISIMFDLGLNIKTFVCDAGTEFIDAFARPETHYFEIDGRRIYHYYDVRYLFMNVRDEFMQYKFHVGQKVAQWSHVLKVYDKDKNHDLSLMPLITDEHVRPPAESRSDTNLAIQVFSSPVAAAMNFHVVTNMAPPKTKDTVEFIQKMSQLYDMFTCSKMSNAYRGTAEQNRMLLDVLEYLRNLQIIDKHGNTIESRFIIALMVNISTMFSLIEELQSENISYLFTKILSKDCLEEFFENCRRLGGNCCERPTSIMFARSFQRFFLESLSYDTQHGGYEQDLKTTLTKIGEHMKADTGVKPESDFDQRKLLTGVSDYKLVRWPSTEYIAGYLLWKCLRNHLCMAFIANLSKQYDLPVEQSAASLIASFQQYNADNVGNDDLPKPPPAFVDFVERLDEKYNEYYKNPNRKSVNFALHMYRTMEQETFELACPCFPMKFLKTLFIRVKIEFCVRDYNRNRKYQRLPRAQGKKQKKK